MKKRAPKPMAPRHLLEELMERQQTLITDHINQLRRVKLKNKA